MYLEKLEGALAGDKQVAGDYDWIMLEMFDQAVRERSGGEMVRYLSQKQLPNESFIFERIGNEGRKLVESIRTEAKKNRSFLKCLLRKMVRILHWRDANCLCRSRGQSRSHGGDQAQDES